MQNNDAAAKYQALVDVKISRLKEMSVERKADLGRRWAELFADVNVSMTIPRVQGRRSSQDDGWICCGSSARVRRLTPR